MKAGWPSTSSTNALAAPLAPATFPASSASTTLAASAVAATARAGITQGGMKLTRSPLAMTGPESATVLGGSPKR
ncbi:MAG: hypothetical protein JW751_29030 [Polyangiaceae bacterium]|nr:hypothetical protein [Polyangiaceae bacterium]